MDAWNVPTSISTFFLLFWKICFYPLNPFLRKHFLYYFEKSSSTHPPHSVWSAWCLRQANMTLCGRRDLFKSKSLLSHKIWKYKQRLLHAVQDSNGWKIHEDRSRNTSDCEPDSLQSPQPLESMSVHWICLKYLQRRYIGEHTKIHTHTALAPSNVSQSSCREFHVWMLF